MSQQERAKWERLQALIEAAETPEQKALLEAISLQTQILQAELAQIRMAVSSSARGGGAVWKP